MQATVRALAHQTPARLQQAAQAAQRGRSCAQAAGHAAGCARRLRTHPQHISGLRSGHGCVQVPLQKFQAAASWMVLTCAQAVPGQAASLNVALCACHDTNASRAEPLARETIWARGMRVRG